MIRAELDIQISLTTHQSLQLQHALHLLMGELGVDADHLGVVEGLDESQHGSGGGQIDVGARLVGLGLQRKSEIVALIYRVVA